MTETSSEGGEQTEQHERRKRRRIGAFLARALRDPLAHFLLAGGLIFAGYAVLNPDTLGDRDGKRITVSHDALLTFVQYRTKAFDPHVAQARLAGLSPHELRKLIDDFVEEEALYREARAMGLDRQDYIIKRRMVQKVEFIASGFDSAPGTIEEPQLRDWYRDHADRFAVPSAYTFTHVFVSGDGRTPQAAMAKARQLRRQLTASHANFADAPGYGERYPYGVNFVEASPEQVTGEFGADFQRQLAALKPDKGLWQGPLTSQYGAHVVMLTALSKPQLPPFEQVRAQVESDMSRAWADRKAEQAVARIVDGYQVDMEFDDPRLSGVRQQQ